MGGCAIPPVVSVPLVNGVRKPCFAEAVPSNSRFAIDAIQKFHQSRSWHKRTSSLRISRSDANELLVQIFSLLSNGHAFSALSLRWAMVVKMEEVCHDEKGELCSD
jgi:hypothetical protein